MSAEKSKKKREITSYSDWMSQLPSELHSVPLYMLAIPGMLFKEHNSCYTANDFKQKNGLSALNFRIFLHFLKIKLHIVLHIINDLK